MRKNINYSFINFNYCYKCICVENNSSCFLHLTDNAGKLKISSS
jgi:hypothetical protein